METTQIITDLLIVAGVGQIAVALCSFSIPHVLKWRQETALLRPLTREVFWTYAAYISTINLAMGFLSALRPEWLLDGSGLGQAIASFIAVYWGVRVIVQFTYYDTSEIPLNRFVAGAKVLMVCAFIALTVFYSIVALGLFR